MNEETQTALAKLLQQITNGIDTAAAFSAEQLPVVIQELLTWNLVSSLMIQIVSLIYMVLFVVYVPKLVSYGCSHKCPTSNEPFVFIGTAVAVVMVIVAMVQFFHNFDWIKIWVAPKLYLLDYATSIVKAS